MKKRWGLFVDDQLMLQYPFTAEGYEEALVDAKIMLERKGILHEIKMF